MFKPDHHLRRYYNKVNKKFFDGKLPPCEVGLNDEIGDNYGMSLKLGDEETKHDIYQIHLNPTWHATLDQLKQTVVHEMCHISLFPYQLHGKRFHDAMKSLAIKGIFDELW